MGEEGIAYDPDFLLLGWARWLPPTALFAYMAVLCLQLQGLPGDLDEQAADGAFAKILESIGGLDGPAWDEQDPRRPPPARRLRAGRIARSLGLERVESNRDVLELMRRIGLVERVEEGGGVRWHTSAPMPMPEERIEMSEQERRAEDRLRWQELHLRTAERVVDLLAGLHLDGAATSLELLGRILEVEAEEVREGLLLLVGEEGAGASADVERVDPGEVFRIEVDWSRFDRARFAGRLVGPDPE